MCGILFRLRKNSNSDDGNSFHKDLWNQLIVKNTQRGPDIQYQFSESLNNIKLDFFGAVLHLRGKSVIKQPLIDSDQNILLWNGEIFDGLEVPFGENDTICLATVLKDSENVSEINDNNDVLNVLQMIEGPYSIIYWQSSKRKLWFGRDCLGRRSLLWHIPSGEEDSFLLTSVGCKIPHGLEHVEAISYFQEVPADGIYCLDIDSMLSSGTLESTSNPFIPAISLEMEQAINQMIDVLGDSVRRRVFDIPRIGGQQDASVAILFSGGLDCICLAALADKYIPHEEPIDLLNVGFENPRIQQTLSRKKKKTTAESDKSKSIYDVPDRLTGRQGVEELRKISPNRIWNFVEVNVPYEQVGQYKGEILELMSPSDTIMDLSIAMAFWFAVRGHGQIARSDGSEEMIRFESKAKVILIGVGADELLAGYSRHREAFNQGGWERLIQEASAISAYVQLDVDRISTRNLELTQLHRLIVNLGRDDRVITSHSKESRFPYLSTNVVSFICSLPMHIKADMRFPRGTGEKLLLRHVARRLGLINASTLWKRAIQFGAKTAKMTNERRGEKGDMKVEYE
ncbi:17198_t:CDS:10 [Cetraspora pellucida]|uniref:17198_t:CDS:1 n=1 Tax=Cetraspora pellucida TaxID=1433469 RepID=A0A9N9BZW8_9GLOM|nr:17198_t:CDS:10 [Cetraspora pellucida]